MIQNIKPFIKWAGGKSQLLEEIRKKYPASIDRYCEPFVGGGVVLLDVLLKFAPSEVMINDINVELINTYRQVQENVDTLITKLKTLQEIFWEADADSRKTIFANNRSCILTEILSENIEKMKSHFSYLLYEIVLE